MRHRLAQRLERIQSFKAMDLREAAWRLERAGHDVIHMEVGEPSFSTIAPVCEAAAASLASGRTQYAPALGLPELRRAIAAYYRRWHGVDVPPERVVVTAGASGAFVLIGALLLDPDSELLLADPGYPCYRYLPELSNARARPVPCGPDVAFQLDAAAVERHWSPATRVALVASPANPTGTVVGRGELARMADAVRARGGTLIVDEIYQGLVYPEALDAPLPAHGRPVAEDGFGTALQVADDVIVVNSFSKYFGMTGWRLGWLVLPEELVPAVEKLAQNFFIAASAPAQYGALEALTDAGIEALEARRALLAERRARLLRGLAGTPVRVPAVPTGAFYVYGDVSASGLHSTEYSRRLLEEQFVAVTPGADFGLHDTHRFVRLSFTPEPDRLDATVERIAAFRP
jgi:aspartate/methionine/tyrosine aminotransferase